MLTIFHLLLLGCITYQLVFLEWQQQQNQPVLTDTRVLTTNWSTLYVNYKSHSHCFSFLSPFSRFVPHLTFLSLHLALQSKVQVLERVASEDFMSGFGCVLIWSLEKESRYSTWIIAVFAAHFRVTRYTSLQILRVFLITAVQSGWISRSYSEEMWRNVWLFMLQEMVI